LWTEGLPNLPMAHGSSMYKPWVVHTDSNVVSGGHAFAYDAVGLVAHYKTASYSFHIFGSDLKSYLFAGDQRACDADAIAHEYGPWNVRANPPTSRPTPTMTGSPATNFSVDASTVLTKIRRFGVSDASWQITNLRNWQNPQSMGPLFNDWYPSRVFANPLQPEYSNSDHIWPRRVLDDPWRHASEAQAP
jgi:hypothetical protein